MKLIEIQSPFASDMKLTLDGLQDGKIPAGNMTNVLLLDIRRLLAGIHSMLLYFTVLSIVGLIVAPIAAIANL